MRSLCIDGGNQNAPVVAASLPPALPDLFSGRTKSEPLGLGVRPRAWRRQTMDRIPLPVPARRAVLHRRVKISRTYSTVVFGVGGSRACPGLFNHDPSSVPCALEGGKITAMPAAR